MTIPLLIFLFSLIPPFAAAQSPSPPQLGFHIAQGDAQHIEAAHAAGAGFVVIVFSWADIDPEENHLYWDVPDATLRAAKFYGLEVVARVDRPPEWAFDATNPSPWQLDSYAQFTQKVAARYGDRLAGIIIWNEPNLSLEWNGRPPVPEGYTQMLRPAYRAIKQVAPGLPVVAAGLAFTNSSDDTAMNDLDFLRGIYEYDGGDYFDVLAAHPYGFGRPPAEPPAPDVVNFRRLELYRQIMADHGDADKPIWITEMGWRTAAPNPDDAWQVVSPRQQRRYTLDAIEYAAENWPWLEKMALWELNAPVDAYGYDLWHGPDDVSLAYQALVDNCEQYNPACRRDPASARAPAAATTDQSPLTILETDAIIRLGDRGTLHPHWVHLYEGGERFSPRWQGEFFLTEAQAEGEYELLFETMQIDQPANRLRLNGVEIGRLQPRPRPDPTSTWATQRFTVPAGVLQPGLNLIDIETGLRNPAWQYSFWRWENFQFRNIRLVQPVDLSPPIFGAWQPHPAPAGWSETNRLRPGLTAADFWLTGNRAGQIWRGAAAGQGTTRLDNQAANRPDLLFTDVLVRPDGHLATTAEGLLWRADDEATWQAIAETPSAYGYVVADYEGRLYAGFEERGLWTARRPTGPWQPTALPSDLTVLDLAFDEAARRLYVATGNGVYYQTGPDGDWHTLPPLPGDNLGESGNPLKRFITRLYLGQAGDVVIRNLDQLWRFSHSELDRVAHREQNPDSAAGNTDLTGWQAFGPTELHAGNKLLAVHDCCGPGTLVGSNDLGLWRLGPADTWRRLDDGFFETTNITEFLGRGDSLYAGGMVALLESADEGRTWDKVEGLPPVISDLVIDPTEPRRWIAATGAGLHRSEDGGQSWETISPPWTVWDLAFGLGGRLYVARTAGVVWADDLSPATIRWQATDGLEDVLFFRVSPHPTGPDILLGGTWGNNLGISYDGGQTMESIHNGLETLSVLDVWQHPIEGQLTVATIEGLYRTDDLGQSWFKLPGALKRQTVYALWQTDDGAIWAGAANGLWVSRDYGVEWQRVEDVPVATVTRLGQVEFRAERWLWAGTERHGLWFSNDDGQTWRFGGLAGLTIYNLLLDPADPTRLIAATDGGIFDFFDN